MNTEETGIGWYGGDAYGRRGENRPPYAKLLEEGKVPVATMSPDKAVRLLNELAKEGLELAKRMDALCKDEEKKPELNRFVTDSEIYVLATQAMIHKERHQSDACWKWTCAWSPRAHARSRGQRNQRGPRARLRTSGGCSLLLVP